MGTAFSPLPNTNTHTHGHSVTLWYIFNYHLVLTWGRFTSATTVMFFIFLHPPLSSTHLLHSSSLYLHFHSFFSLLSILLFFVSFHLRYLHFLFPLISVLFTFSFSLPSCSPPLLSLFHNALGYTCDFLLLCRHGLEATNRQK